MLVKERFKFEVDYLGRVRAIDSNGGIMIEEDPSVSTLLLLGFDCRVAVMSSTLRKARMAGVKRLNYSEKGGTRRYFATRGLNDTYLRKDRR